MAKVQPGGSASVQGGNVPLSFPLMPQAWPLTVIPGSDPVSAEALPQDPNPASAAQTTIITAALTQSSNANNSLI